MEEYLKLDCGWFKRLLYHGIEKESLKFFNDYTNWCSKNNKHIDFIEPLAWHLFCMGYSKWKVNKYLEFVRSKILSGVRRQMNDKDS